MAEIFAIESGALPAGTRVAAFTGRERLSTPFRYDLWLLVPEADALDLDATTVVLQPATLLIVRDDGTPRARTSGLLSSLELVNEQPGGDALYRATLVPTLWKLGLGRHSRVWVDTSIPDVLADVFRKGGIPDARVANRLRGRYAARPHVCQYRESDLAFVSRWMEREGITYFFEHGDDGDVLVLVDDKTAHAPGPDAPVRFIPEDPRGDSGNDGFRLFSQRAVYRPREFRLKDYDPLAPPSDVSGRADVVASHAGDVVRYGEDNFPSAGAGGRVATVRAEERLAELATVRAQGRVFDVHPGFTFELEEHPRAGFNRAYLALELACRGRLLTGSEMDRWVPAPDHRAYWETVTAIPSDVQFRPPLVTPAPRVAGVEVGHVDGPADSDYAQLDEHGRYLIRLHFDENDNPDGAASTRVRMMQPHNGAPEGLHFPLRKDTEVMVIFQGGDPDRPLIAAAVPNADTPSPVTDANGTQNVIHTGGDNRFELEDTAGSQYVDVYSPPQRTQIHLGAHHGSHAHNYVSSTDGNGLIHTGANLDVTVGGRKHEHVKGTVRETYKATQSTEVTLTVTESYHADMETTVTGHVQEDYKTHTTNVTAKTIERCASQDTTVSGLLDEHHKKQKSLIDGRLYVHSATHSARAGTSTCEYGTLLIGVKGAFTLNSAGPIRINALNWQDNAPISYRIVTNVRRVIHNASKAVVYPMFFELIGNKTSNGIFNLNLNRWKADAGGIATAINVIKIDYTKFKLEMGGQKIKPVGFSGKKVDFKSDTFAISFFG